MAFYNFKCSSVAHLGGEFSTTGLVLMDWISVVTLTVCSGFWQQSFIFGLYDISLITAIFFSREFVNIIVSENCYGSW